MGKEWDALGLGSWGSLAPDSDGYARQRWGGEVLRRCSRMDQFAMSEFETEAAVAVADGIGAPAAP